MNTNEIEKGDNTREQNEGTPITKTDSRQIMIVGTINERTSAGVVNALLGFEHKNPLEPILLTIDSSGGDIDAMFAIIDAMNLIRCEVITLCIGKAMSAGAILLLNGAKGQRYITPHARVMLHQISSIHAGTTADIDNSIKEVQRLQDALITLIESRTKLRGKQLRTILSKDSYITATQAVRHGIVDKVVSRFPTKGI